MPSSRQDVQQGGNVITEPDIAFALGNWASIVAFGAAAVPIPHTQTGPNATFVAAMTMMPVSSGIFFVAVRASFSDGTTAGALTSSLFTKQGATTGIVSGGVAALKSGTGAPAAGTGLAAFTGTQGQLLNVDANGGAGLLFEGAAFGGVAQHSDAQATLTGLLTANGIGVQNFEFIGMVDAVGPTSLAKTPFTLLLPMCIALGVSDTAAHVVTYNSLSMFAIEIPQR